MAEHHELAERPPGDAPPEATPPTPTPPVRPRGLFDGGLPTISADPEAPGSFPPDPSAPVEETYRSLSVPALLGFSLAAFYAAMVVLLGAVSFFSNRPLLLSGWTFLLPLAAALICLVARLQVRNAEGTLAGAALARWGLLLSVFIGLTYFAYSAAVYLALRQQSEAFAREWLELVRQGQLDRAAYRTLRPQQRINLREDDPDLPRKLDLRTGGEDAGDSSAGLYTQFQKTVLVRMLTSGQQGTPAEAIFEPRGVKAWDYAQGSFRVVLGYHVRTPESTFNMDVTVHGSESPRKGEGRQWFVNLWEGTGITEWEAPIQYTPLGQARQALQESGMAYLFQWHEMLASQRSLEAFLSTLPQDQQERFGTVLGLGGVAGGGSAFHATDDPELVNGYRRFQGGDLLEVGSNPLLAEGTLRDRAVSGIRKLFQPGLDGSSGPIPSFSPGRAPPARILLDDKVRYGFDVQLTDDQSFRALGVVFLETDARVLEATDTPPRWRVASLRLVAAMAPRSRDE